MAAKTFQPVSLALDTRAALPTPEAAYHLNRAPQTLRLWSMRNDGPVKCLRVGGRLQWPVDQIKTVMGVHEQGQQHTRQVSTLKERIPALTPSDSIGL